MTKPALFAAMVFGMTAWGQVPSTSFKFSFGSGDAAPGYTKVLPDMSYTDARGFGFEDSTALKAISRSGPDPLRSGLITSDKPPFYFSVKVPEEGNYKVTVTFGDQEAASVTTVKAELRRLMLEKVVTQPGEFVTRTFVVNVRRSQLAGGASIKMRESEAQWETRAWDDKLTLEFTDSHPAVCAIEIRKADDLPTLYLVGDSTVADLWQEPFASWGQMLPRFFKPDIAVANHAESGETLKMFLAENRWAKVLSLIKPGDYLFIQMGHNDQKEEGPGIGPFTSFKSDLKRFVADARAHGANPVLITSVHRMIFGPDGKITDTHGDYLVAVRQLAREENVSLIDLAVMSKTLYEALGPKDTIKAQADATHHNNFGSYELAKCVVEGIKSTKLPISQFLVDLPPFDPRHPDSVAQFNLPAEPFVKVPNPY